ncbi:MAG TPA: phosphopentomutase [Gemmatimonadales bacterium]|nr:phosphopentomutase [Gemmatimonadales bacterium]
MTRRAAIVVLDGLGVGPAHDTDQYGDSGSHTLGNVVRSASGLRLPNLEALGLGRTADLGSIRSVSTPQAAHGSCEPASPGKDSTTGHWEICGLLLAEPFPTFPEGFPEDLLREFSRRTGRGVLANKAGSGTALLEEFGAAHVASGDWIVYTSADSVFQVAAHEDVVPLEELYRACAIGRDMLQPPVGVSRVIARPFRGSPGRWERTPDRRDFSLAPPGVTLLDRLAAAGIARVGVGKVDDLFAGRAIESIHTKTNQEAYRLIRDALQTMAQGFLFANVIEFDQTWGHRNDIQGFVDGLRELDEAMPSILDATRADDLIIFTADHGNDPTTPSTDHSREVVPVLAYGPKIAAIDLGRRTTFADMGQTVAEFLGVEPLSAGKSFLSEVWRG